MVNTAVTQRVAQANKLLAQPNKRSVVAIGYEMVCCCWLSGAERVKALVSWTVPWAAVALLAILSFRTLAALFALIWFRTKESFGIVDRAVGGGSGAGDSDLPRLCGAVRSGLVVILVIDAALYFEEEPSRQSAASSRRMRRRIVVNIAKPELLASK